MLIAVSSWCSNVNSIGIRRHRARDVGTENGPNCIGSMSVSVDGIKDACDDWTPEVKACKEGASGLSSIGPKWIGRGGRLGASARNIRTIGLGSLNPKWQHIYIWIVFPEPPASCNEPPCSNNNIHQSPTLAIHGGETVMGMTNAVKTHFSLSDPRVESVYVFTASSICRAAMFQCFGCVST